MASRTNMGYTPFEFTLISAKDLKDVNLFSKMDVYAVVCLSGDPYRNQEVRTPVHRNGGTNPTWNSAMKFTISESAARQNRLALQVKLRSARRVFGDKVVGVVDVLINELLDDLGDGETPKIVSYPVRRPSGKFKSLLNFSYNFGEMVAAPECFPQDEPVTAHPHLVVGSGSVPAQYGMGHGYPPPQYQSGYPQASGGYAPPQPGYGYPPERNNFGMYLGAGLLGRAVEGMLIGEMGSDGGFDGFF